MQENNEIIPEGFKKCCGKHGCNKILPLGEFSFIVKRHKYNNICRGCHNISMTNRRNQIKKEKAQLKEQLPEGFKKCCGEHGCGKILPLTDFYFLKSKNKYHSNCNICHNIYNKKMKLIKKQKEPVKEQTNTPQGFKKCYSKKLDHCDEILPLSEFEFVKGKRYNTICKTCNNNYERKRYYKRSEPKRKEMEKRKEEIRKQIPDGCKKCGKCKIIKPLDSFYYSKDTKDLHDTECKDCIKIRDKKYTDNIIVKQRKKKQGAEYYKNNKEKNYKKK